MKKSSLKDWFKLEVWRQSGGTLPELCDLADIREWLNETADDPDLDERISIVEADTTDLLDRTTALEAIVQTAAPGAPVAPVASSVSLPIGEGISLDITAKTKGVIGDSITIALIDPKADGNIDVAVTKSAIVVTLGYGTGEITSTLADVKAAIKDDEDAGALVSVAITGLDTTLAIAVDKTNLAGGGDGTVGAAGALRYFDTDLYVSVGESTKDVSNWLSAPLLPTLPTVIDLSDASEAYVIKEGKKNSIVVLTNNAVDAVDIVLPSAIVGLRVTIINQDNADVDITAASGDYINVSDSIPFELAKLTSATFYCYADGKWAII